MSSISESIAYEYLVQLEKYIKSLKQNIENIDNLHLVDSPSNVYDLKMELVKIRNWQLLMSRHVNRTLVKVIKLQDSLHSPKNVVDIKKYYDLK